MSKPMEAITEHAPLHEVKPRVTTIGIIDAGSQLLKPIDRKIREIGADTIIYPHDVTAEQLLQECDAIVVSGGGDSTYAPDAVHCDPRIYEADFPLAGLFICFGMQQMNQARGGTVEQGANGRYGQCTIEITEPDSPLFTGLGKNTKVLMNAGDCVTSANLAPGLQILALSREGDHETVAAFTDKTGKKIGVQFHPEVDLTEHGEDLFRRFIHDVAGLPLDYTPKAKRITTQNFIRATVGRHLVVTGLSGGVDSSVAAAVIDSEIRERQHGIHIDTGMMRKGESQLVMKALQERGLPNVHFIDAAEVFRRARTHYNGRLTRQLQYEVDPEAKRHIIGDTFARLFNDALRELGLDPDTAFLAQGTLRPDLIESAGVGQKAKKIKTHHNDSPLIRDWRARGKVIEPLSDLHKDEVRQLGLELGLPDEVVWRHPFPGPGLGIRIVCAYEAADFAGRPGVEDKLRDFADADTSVSLLPIRTVGVQGDDRTYRHVAAITTTGEPDWKRYMEYAAAIPKAFRDISRVVFMAGEQINQNRSLFDTVVRTTLTPRIIETLQEADDAITYAINQHGLLRKLAQEPVILTPLKIDNKKGRLLVVRPFVTNDFMVGSAAVPGSEQLPLAALKSQYEAAMSVRGISRFAIDLTGKPPGTVEWE